MQKYINMQKINERGGYSEKLKIFLFCGKKDKIDEIF